MPPFDISPSEFQFQPDPVREAILKAADHIERNPHQFAYYLAWTPKDSRQQSCAIGWVGYFMGEAASQHCGSLFEENEAALPVRLFGVSFSDFHTRMTRICGMDWKERAAVCASALRAYANTYHPAPTYARAVA